MKACVFSTPEFLTKIFYKELLPPIQRWDTSEMSRSSSTSILQEMYFSWKELNSSIKTTFKYNKKLLSWKSQNGFRLIWMAVFSLVLKSQKSLGIPPENFWIFQDDLEKILSRLHNDVVKNSEWSQKHLTNIFSKIKEWSRRSCTNLTKITQRSGKDPRTSWWSHRDPQKI